MVEISVIMPVYNAEKYLNQALKSNFHIRWNEKRFLKNDWVERYDEFIIWFPKKNKSIFENALDCDDYQEYEFKECKVQIEELTKHKNQLVDLKMCLRKLMII